MNATPKLELKHISPYLPYGLTVHSDYNNRTEKIVGMCQYIDGFEIKTVDATKDNPVIWSWKEGEFRPYLRPLTDLTKEIEHNGEIFIPMAKLCLIANDWLGTPVIKTAESKNNPHTIQTLKGYIFGYSGEGFYIKDGHYGWSVENQVSLFNALNEWHFDYAYNLIDQNLAIPK